MNRPLLHDNADQLKSALAFLTSLPIDAPVPSVETLNMFPLAGMLLGVTEGLVYKLLKKILPSYMAAATTVLFDLIITSGMHLDGLADSADALLAHVPEKSRFLIMEEPVVGVYGATAIVMFLLLKTLALTNDEVLSADFMLVMALSRGLAKTIIQKSTYAKADGLVTKFQENRKSTDTPSGDKGQAPFSIDLGIVTMAISVILFILLGYRKKILKKSSFSLLLSLGIVAFIHKNAKSKLGGYTGDTIGASIAIYELSYLLFRNLGFTTKNRRLF